MAEQQEGQEFQENSEVAQATQADQNTEANQADLASDSDNNVGGGDTFAEATAEDTADIDTSLTTADLRRSDVEGGIRLPQTDDQPRASIHPKLSVGAIKQLQEAGENWLDYFDPQEGFEASAKEVDKMILPVKVTSLMPKMSGPAKDKQPVLENGRQVYINKSINKDFSVLFDKDAAVQAINSVVPDAMSKYLLEHFTKPLNKPTPNPHYGELKAAAMPISTAFPISFDVVEAISGVSFLDFLEGMFRAGWFKKTARREQYEVEAHCGVHPQKEAIFAAKGDAISKWTTRQFPGQVSVAKTFKDVGKLVANQMVVRGAGPSENQLFSVLDCINIHCQQFERNLDKGKRMQAMVDDPSNPLTELPAGAAELLERVDIEYRHWVLVSCAIEGLAKQKEAENKKKLAAITAASADSASDALTFDSLEDLGLDLDPIGKL